MKFVDEVSIVVGSGRGGPGKISFRKEAMVPRGGPDGGDGGKGGDVVFVSSPHLNSLVDFRRNKKYLAENGHPGSYKDQSGANGQDLVLKVPVGTIIKNENGEILADLAEAERLVLARGGRGGKGNTFFKTCVNQAPEHAQPGEEGVILNVTLELKLIADVGIIGFPNAGKSTLISRISAAKPKIADYPFTTLTPNLGVVRVDDEKSFVVADIPGLIRGAHLGAGLGIQFLKHIERTKIFIHLIDASGFSGEEPEKLFVDLNNELNQYDEINKDEIGFFPLSKRPQIVVLNKTELLDADTKESLMKKFKKDFGVQIHLISAVAGLGLTELLKALSEKIFNEDDNI